MSQQQTEKHFSPCTTNILLGVSVVILVATVLIRFLTTAPQEWVLALMGIGVFLFLLVAFDQPAETE
jgi:prepilin signal peptidase PulO-like enzyme (type II secretory pathway)